MPNYWMENATNHGKHVLVDCGPTQSAEAHFNVLRPHLALSNFQRVGNDRLVVRIPPKKVSAVLAKIPQIKEGIAGYCWCTHGFEPHPSDSKPSPLGD